MTSFLERQTKKARRFYSLWRYSRFQKKYASDLTFNEATVTFKDRNDMYSYMHHYFHHLAPPFVKAHRQYYKRDLRGFGEDAFHSMWWLLLAEYRPTRCLEIGVYRGQVLSLWAMIAKHLGMEIDVYGISPFSPAGDDVSTYLQNLDYLEDTVTSFHRLELPAPKLVKAFSTDQQAIDLISSLEWDLIYIDGSHDYDVVLADYRLCKEHLKPGGILVLDDSAGDTEYEPPPFAFKGHPGPSRVSGQFGMKELELVTAVGHNTVFRKPVSA